MLTFSVFLCCPQRGAHILSHSPFRSTQTSQVLIFMSGPVLQIPNTVATVDIPVVFKRNFCWKSARLVLTLGSCIFTSSCHYSAGKGNCIDVCVKLPNSASAGMWQCHRSDHTAHGATCWLPTSGRTAAAAIKDAYYQWFINVISFFIYLLAREGSCVTCQVIQPDLSSRACYVVWLCFTLYYTTKMLYSAFIIYNTHDIFILLVIFIWIVQLCDMLESSTAYLVTLHIMYPVFDIM